MGNKEVIITKPLGAVMNLTNQCNFRCKYCFVSHNNKRANFETVKATCEYLLKNCEDTKPNLWFFGGEPMLEYKTIIKPIVLEYSSRMTFGITTNGSLLSEDVIDFLYDNNISILLSIDGGEVVQNHQRPYIDGSPSFEKVCRNIPYLLLKYPDTTFRATLTKFSIPYMNDTYDFARHMGFKSIAFVINEEEEYDQQDELELKKQYDEIAIKILNGSTLWLDDIDKAEEFLFHSSEFQTFYRCGYGTTSMGVTVNGDITPCQELNSLENPIIIGNVFTGIDIEKHNNFLSSTNHPIKLPENLDKELQIMCANGVCPKKQYTNNQFSITSGRLIQLKAMRKLYKHFHKVTNYSGNLYWKGISR